MGITHYKDRKVLRPSQLYDGNPRVHVRPVLVLGRRPVSWIPDSKVGWPNVDPTSVYCRPDFGPTLAQPTFVAVRDGLTMKHSVKYTSQTAILEGPTSALSSRRWLINVGQTNITGLVPSSTQGIHSPLTFQFTVVIRNNMLHLEISYVATESLIDAQDTCREEQQ